MKLHARVVPYSSTVGSSVMLEGDKGEVVAILMISIPSPSLPYKETATGVADLVVRALNRKDEG